MLRGHQDEQHTETCTFDHNYKEFGVNRSHQAAIRVAMYIRIPSIGIAGYIIEPNVKFGGIV